MQLEPNAQRVLGSLVEKAMTTPDGYPLSLNALRTACNQKTARDPVLTLTDDEVTAGLAELREHGLVLTRYAHGSRVPKYAHLLDEKLDLSAPQVAVVGVLLLRGPQTPGELRQRTSRMHDFASTEDVQAILDSLVEHKFGALAEALPRAPGQKEERHRHLLGPVTQAPAVAAAGEEADQLRAELEAARSEVARLEQDNARLQAELATLQAEVDALTAPG